MKQFKYICQNAPINPLVSSSPTKWVQFYDYMRQECGLNPDSSAIEQGLNDNLSTNELMTICYDAWYDAYLAS